MVDGIKEMALNLLSWAFSFFQSNIGSAVDILKIDVSSGDYWSTAEGLSNNLKGATSVILCLCATMEMAICFSKIDSMRMETAIRIGVKFTLTKVFCDNVTGLLLAIYKQTQSWIGSFSGAVDAMGENISKMIDQVNKYSGDAFNTFSGLGTAISIFLVVIVVLLAIVACGLLIRVMAYARIFEILAYVVIAPLPCAFLPLTGSMDVGVNNITKRFFKSFIGVCLQGVVMLVCIHVFDTVVCGSLTKLDIFNKTITDEDKNLDIVTNLSNMLWTMALSAVALVVSVSKSGSWAKSMVDGA